MTKHAKLYYNKVMLTVKSLEKKAIGREIKLKKGDKILAFDGFDAEDLLDYLYFDGQNRFTLSIERRSGKKVDFDIEKDDDETLGLTFESDNLDIKTCKNKCVFCFVEQMPCGLRDSLYVKDDDYRQSFLCGNFVTLTNICEKDVERIIRLHLSPLYVSVHTMNGELRKKMMNNRFADRSVEYIKRMCEGGISLHTQVVLVPGLNDGKELDYTLRELHKLSDKVCSVAVVPCGITKFRDGLYPIKDIDAEYAARVIQQIDKLNAEFNGQFVFPADEFYIRAGLPLKKASEYGNYSQLENGVGMVTKFLDEFERALQKRKYDRRFLICVGTSAYEIIKKCAERIENNVEGVKIAVIQKQNEFFGHTVTCCGLLTGADVYSAVKAYGNEYDELVLPPYMFKQTEKVFLDGMTLEELSERIGKPVRVTDGSGEDFFDKLSAEL